MKRILRSPHPLTRFAAALAISVSLGALLFAQSSVNGIVPALNSGNITATDAGTCAFSNTGCVVLQTRGYSALSIQVSGTWTGTLAFESCSSNCSVAASWSGTTVTPPGSTTSVTATTANGLWVGSVPTQFVRVRGTTVSSGTATVLLYATMGGLPTATIQSTINNITPNLSAPSQWQQARQYFETSSTPGNGSYSLAFGRPSGSLGGTVTANSQPDAQYSKVTGTTTINTYIGVSACNCSGGQITDDILNWTCDWLVRTDSTVANMIFWIGWGTLTNAAPTNSGTISASATDRYQVVRYLDGTDANWVGVSWNGAAQTVTSQLAAGPLLTNTTYRIRIQRAGTTIMYSVNGGATATLTAAAGTAKGENTFWGAYNLIAATRAFSWAYTACSIGGPFS